jgi:glycosyltransferase involved in cell wall biosynthesis
MLTVLHVGKFYPPVPGGMERVVESLCQATRGRLESRVLAVHTGAGTVEEIVDGVPVTRVGTWGAAGSVPVAPALAAHLKRAEADVMIVHEPNPWALLSYLVARPRVPLAMWFHSEVVRPRLQYQAFYAPMAEPVYRRARRIAVSSLSLGERAVALQPHQSRLSVIPFGIDADAWAPRDEVSRRAHEIRAGAPGPVVLFAGRHVAYKGVDVLIRAVRTLPVTLTVAGDGPMRASWERLSRVEPTRARIQFIGEVDDEELKAQMHACDVFVLPSVTRAEAFGFVQLEAMACGKPVVSTSVESGVPWVNRHDESGVVVPPGDVHALADALTRLTADAGLRSRLGEAGSSRVRRDFTLPMMADRFVSFCHEVAAA